MMSGKWVKMEAGHFLFVIIYLFTFTLATVTCQYRQNMEQVPVDYYGNYGGGGGGGYDSGSYSQEQEVDERPKINLGIRLKIPAIKFELPRFNMPKITVSAKIRQPDRPRVISLPEINLDTQSSSAANNAITSGRPVVRSYPKSPGAYGSGNKPNVMQQQHQQEREQTFTLSTHSETKPKQEEDESRQQNYRKTNQVSQMKSPSYHMRTNSYNKPHQQAISVPAYASSQQHNQLTGSLSSSDLGFDAPIYVKPKEIGQPIEAYGRRPVRVMQYSGNSDNFQNHNFLSAQEVFVDSRSLRHGYFV